MNPPMVLGIWYYMLVGSCLGQTIRSIFHCQLSIAASGTTDAAGAALIARLTGGGFVTSYLSMMPTNYTLNNIRVQQIFTPRARYVQSAVVGGVGTFGSAAGTANTVGVVQKTGNLSGKHQRGSVRLLYPVNTVTMADGEVSGAWTTAAALFAANVIGPFVDPSGNNWVNGLWPAKGTAVGQFVPVTAATPLLTLRVQRRRTLNVGE